MENGVEGRPLSCPYLSKTAKGDFCCTATEDVQPQTREIQYDLVTEKLTSLCVDLRQYPNCPSFQRHRHLLRLLEREKL